MTKIFLISTIICGTGWGFTFFLYKTLICYLKRKGNPPREELRDCAEHVIRNFLKKR